MPLRFTAIDLVGGNGERVRLVLRLVDPRRSYRYAGPTYADDRRFGAITPAERIALFTIATLIGGEVIFLIFLYLWPN